MKMEHTTEYRSLGLKINYYRKLRGYTQEQLAEAVNKSPDFIGHVEAPNVSKTLSLDTLFDIAKFLGVPAYRFLEIDDD